MLLNVISTLSQQESEKIYERLIYSETKENGKNAFYYRFHSACSNSHDNNGQNVECLVRSKQIYQIHLII